MTNPLKEYVTYLYGNANKKYCACGKECVSRFGKLCPECLREARSRAGKMCAGKKLKGERKATPGHQRKAGPKVVAKCPTCWAMHIVRDIVELNKMPRIYCPAHVDRRTDFF